MQDVARGWQNFRRHFAVAGWLYLGKLSLSLVFALPLLAVVSGTLDNSAFASVLLKTWSFDVIRELLHRHEEVLPAFVAVLIFYSVAVFFFKQFVNGGIYFTFMAARGVVVKSFFAEAAGLFRGNLKISLFMLFVYSTLAIMSQSVAAMIPEDLTGHFGEAAFGGAFMHLVCLYVFLIPASILSDVLRLRLAAFPDQKFLSQLRPAVNFYLRRFVKLHSIYYLYFLPMVILWLIIERSALALTGGLANIIGVFLEMVLFQLCSFARTSQSLLFTASIAPLTSDALGGRFNEEKGSQEARVD
ncbi:MAG: hypothetical protein GY867_02960 [bacterium]|nr:hypothetical protein [bacterium]